MTMYRWIDELCIKSVMIFSIFFQAVIVDPGNELIKPIDINMLKNTFLAWCWWMIGVVMHSFNFHLELDLVGFCHYT
jgi:hypothetical protein